MRGSKLNFRPCLKHILISKKLRALKALRMRFLKMFWLDAEEGSKAPQASAHLEKNPNDIGLEH